MKDFIYNGTGIVRTDMGEETLSLEPGQTFQADENHPFISGMIERKLAVPYTPEAPLTPRDNEEED